MVVEPTSGVGRLRIIPAMAPTEKSDPAGPRRGVPPRGPTWISWAIAAFAVIVLILLLVLWGMRPGRQGQPGQPGQPGPGAAATSALHDPAPHDPAPHAPAAVSRFFEPADSDGPRIHVTRTPMSLPPGPAAMR